MVFNVPPLSPASRVVRGDGFIDAEVDGEVVALNIEKGTCYGLNKVGSRIWHLLGKPISIKEICAALISEYDVDAGVCERQVFELLQELRAEGLVQTPNQQ
jgi:hypothetical protein